MCLLAIGSHFEPQMTPYILCSWGNFEVSLVHVLEEIDSVTTGLSVWCNFILKYVWHRLQCELQVKWHYISIGCRYVWMLLMQNHTPSTMMQCHTTAMLKVLILQKVLSHVTLTNAMAYHIYQRWQPPTSTYSTSSVLSLKIFVASDFDKKPEQQSIISSIITWIF